MITIFNIIGGFSGGVPTLGTIFSETSFASATNFPITAATITRGTNKLDMSGSPSLFGSYVRFDNSSSAHRYTGLEHWKQRLRVKTPSSITGSSYGIGIGVHSANTYDPYSTTLRWSWDTGGPGALGSLYLYNKLTTAGQIQSSGSYTPVAGTYYWVEVERIKNQVKFTVYSDALALLFTETLSFVLNSGYVQAHNVGQFCIQHFGGSGIEVTNWTTTSSARKNQDYVFIGDSNTYGLFSATNALRWAENAATTAGKTFVINAGIADRTADVILKLDEIIALNPTNVFLSIGRNDVANSITIGTIQTNINTIISTLEAAGITVKLGGVVASNVDVSAVQTHYNGKSNTKVNFYTDSKSGTTTLKAGYDGGDGIHLNATGHAGLSTLAQTIL